MMKRNKFEKRNESQSYDKKETKKRFLHQNFLHWSNYMSLTLFSITYILKTQLNFTMKTEIVSILYLATQVQLR